MVQSAYGQATHSNEPESALLLAGGRVPPGCTQMSEERLLQNQCSGPGSTGSGEADPFFSVHPLSLLHFVPNLSISTLKNKFLNEIRKKGFPPQGSLQSNRREPTTTHQAFLTWKP